MNDNNFTIFRNRDFLKEYLPEYKELIKKNREYENYMTYDNKKVERIKMGSENLFFEENKYGYISEIYEKEYCHNCLAKRGEYHLFQDSCDLEVCPVCGKQLITCGCINYMIK